MPDKHTYRVTWWFDAVKNGLPSQLRAAGAVGVGFLSCEDRKNDRMRCSNSVQWC